MALVNRILGCTRVLGKTQGYKGLPVRDEKVTVPTTPEPVNIMYSAWEITPEEIAKLHLGLPLIIGIVGNSHPPIVVKVGDENYL